MDHWHPADHIWEDNKVKSRLLLSLLAVTSNAALANSSVVSVKTEKVNPWKASYYNEAYGPALKQEAKSYSSYHHLILTRMIGDDGASLSAIFVGLSEFGQDVEEKTSPYNHYLKLSGSPVFSNDFVSVTPQLRVYSALSQAAKDAKEAATINPRMYVSSSLGDLDLLYGLFTYFYTYRESYATKRRVAHGHYLKGSYNVTPSFSLDMFVYPKWTHSGKEGPNVAYNDVNLGPGVTGKLTDKITVSGWIDTYAVNYKPSRALWAASLKVALL